MPDIIIPATKAASLIAKFGKNVIERWTEHRRMHFLNELIEHVQIEQASGDREFSVDESLDFLLKDEANSEILYDAYRRVCLSKTKTWGPRVIGVLTAELINHGKTANEEEEMIFDACENLGDLEFRQFLDHYDYLFKEIAKETTNARRVMKAGDDIIEISDDQHYEANTGERTEVQLSADSLRQTHGSWASKLESYGLLERKVTQSTVLVKEDSERHIDYDQEWVTTSTVITYPKSLLRLYQLLRRVRNEAV